MPSQNCISGVRRCVTVIAIAFLGFSALAMLRIPGAGAVSPGPGQQKPLLEGLRLSIAIRSEQVRPDGAVWGTFAVAVTARNSAKSAIRGAGVVVEHVVTNPRYPRMSPITSVQAIPLPALGPDESATVVLDGFRVNHPELIQEIIANVPGSDGIAKTRIRASFAPGSQD